MNHKKKHPGRIILAVAVVAAAAAGTATVWYQKQSQNAAEALSAYKTETVRRGNVTSGISESGTVEFGTKEQIFAVAEITQVSLTDDSDSESTVSSSSANLSDKFSGGTQGSMAMGGSSGGAGMTAMGSGASETASSSSGENSSSGSEAALTVEEVYAASGQVISEGDRILKITEDSI